MDSVDLRHFLKALVDSARDLRAVCEWALFDFVVDAALSRWGRRVSRENACHDDEALMRLDVSSVSIIVNEERNGTERNGSGVVSYCGVMIIRVGYLCTCRRLVLLQANST